MAPFPRFRYLVVIIATLLATGCFATGALWTASRVLRWDVGSDLFGLGLFACVIGVTGGSVYALSQWLLYRSTPPADFHVIGGVRFGGRLQVMATGRTATWPFARLSVSRTGLELETPWGPLQWDRAALPSPFKERGLFPGSWTITEHSPKTGTSITFSVPPWRSRQVRENLLRLGYKTER